MSDQATARRGQHLIGCAITILGLLAATAVPAHGDPDDGPSTADQSFLAALNAQDIVYSDPGKAIKAGHTMCELVDQGKSGKALVAMLQKHNDSLTTEHAAQFMAIAFQVYCPGNFEAGMKGLKPKP